MNDVANLAIEDAKRLNERLLRDFAKIPDERLNWSPSPTCRTPLQLIAHCAFSLGFIHDMLNGSPYPVKSMAEADAGFLKMELEITSREQALAFWRERFDIYMSFLQSFESDQLEQMVMLSFGMGSLPMHFMAGMGAIHTREHIAQLEYLKTVYGDREW